MNLLYIDFIFISLLWAESFLLNELLSCLDKLSVNRKYRFDVIFDKDWILNYNDYFQKYNTWIISVPKVHKVCNIYYSPESGKWSSLCHENG